MASPFTIHIGPSDTGLWRIQQTEAAAKCTSRLLQHDIDVSLYRDIYDYTTEKGVMSLELSCFLQRRRLS